MTRENTKYCIMHANSNNNAGYAALKCSDTKKVFIGFCFCIVGIFKDVCLQFNVHSGHCRIAPDFCFL